MILSAELILLLLAFAKYNGINPSELSIAIRDGDHKAFKTFHDEYYDGLYRFMVSCGMSHAEAEDLTIRLTPQAIQANEIIVSGFYGFNPADTLLSGMIDAGRFSPLGESNSIRALQAHPAVANGTALNGGMNIRGSTPDGILVLLDGISIFNQSHIYGLLDSFNSNAVQSSGFYYGVTPANIDTPTCGSLNLITRTGSRSAYRGSAGISNTSVNGTLEGPFGNRSSWLVSARASCLDLANWFNNSDQIQ